MAAFYGAVPMNGLTTLGFNFGVVAEEQPSASQGHDRVQESSRTRGSGSECRGAERTPRGGGPRRRSRAEEEDGSEWSGGEEGLELDEEEEEEEEEALSSRGGGGGGGTPGGPARGSRGSRGGPGGGGGKAKRILANRQSAQRSRMRKLHFIAELEAKVARLQCSVAELTPLLEQLRAKRDELAHRHDELRACALHVMQKMRTSRAAHDAAEAECRALAGRAAAAAAAARRGSLQAKQEGLGKMGAGGRGVIELTATAASGQLPVPLLHPLGLRTALEAQTPPSRGTCSVESPFASLSKAGLP